MDRLTRVLAGLLRCLAGLLGEHVAGCAAHRRALGALRGHLRYAPAVLDPTAFPRGRDGSVAGVAACPSVPACV